MLRKMLYLSVLLNYNKPFMMILSDSYEPASSAKKVVVLTNSTLSEILRDGLVTLCAQENNAILPFKDDIFSREGRLQLDIYFPQISA